MLSRWTTATDVPGPASPPSGRLSGEQVIDRILELNPTASPAFLGQFDAESLRSYLEHLLSARQPRGERSRWVRPAGSRAICSSERAA